MFLQQTGTLDFSCGPPGLRLSFPPHILRGCSQKQNCRNTTRPPEHAPNLESHILGCHDRGTEIRRSGMAQPQDTAVFNTPTALIPTLTHAPLPPASPDGAVTHHTLARRPILNSPSTRVLATSYLPVANFRNTPAAVSTTETENLAFLYFVCLRFRSLFW